jgi:hypothetical protein
MVPSFTLQKMIRGEFCPTSLCGVRLIMIGPTKTQNDGAYLRPITPDFIASDDYPK